ncbi:extracellular serine-rich protein, partial [Thozetella sp. PMI_491]
RFVVNAVAGSSVNKVIPIVVGGSTLTFFPNSVSANPGDILQFQFAARNHTVTQSSESNPCQPLLDTVGNAVHSGFVPYENGSSTVGTFNVPVKDTNPMFLYCAQGQHCQAGMVMAINPSSSQQLIVYANNAATAKNNVPGKFISGGASGVLPAASAAF